MLFPVVRVQFKIEGHRVMCTCEKIPKVAEPVFTLKQTVRFVFDAKLYKALSCQQSASLRWQIYDACSSCCFTLIRLRTTWSTCVISFTPTTTTYFCLKDGSLMVMSLSHSPCCPTSNSEWFSLIKVKVTGEREKNTALSALSLIHISEPTRR